MFNFLQTAVIIIIMYFSFYLPFSLPLFISAELKLEGTKMVNKKREDIALFKKK